MRVRVPLRPLTIQTGEQQCSLAYIIGAALGDGNLSNPNGRAIRLRISCDDHYPLIKKEIEKNLRNILPRNAIITVKTPRSCTDIGVYSNELGKRMPWTVGKGTKQEQNARVPQWIFTEKDFVISCLKGLLQTDGSIYLDRGYLMINFTNNVRALCEDVVAMMYLLGFKSTFHKARNRSGTTKYTVRLARNAKEFIKQIDLQKF